MNSENLVYYHFQGQLHVNESAKFVVGQNVRLNNHTFYTVYSACSYSTLLSVL